MPSSTTGRTAACRCATGWTAIVQIEVTDTGLGMTEADCLRLFEPFNRLSQTMGAIEGTGIGLTVTRGLVSLMGGQIRVSSTLGRGSVFTVTLPG